MTPIEKLTERQQYYCNLLIQQYKNKPKAEATIKYLTSLLFLNDIFSQIGEKYKVDSAVGKQLDNLAIPMGINRIHENALMNDDDFRILIKLKIIKNNSTASTIEVVNNLYNFFSNNIIVDDNLQMSYIYFINPAFSNVILAAIQKDIIPVPMGVGLQYVILSTKFLGLTDSQQSNINDPRIVGLSDASNFLTQEGSMFSSKDILI